MKKIKKKALVFGGAFNPPTRAHIELGKQAMQKCNAERVIYVPTKETYIENSQKKDFAFSNEERLRMLRMIAIDTPWMEVSDFEILSPEQPRTYLTLQHLSENYECRLLIGSDKLKELETGWLYVRQIAEQFGIAVISRGSDNAAEIIADDPYLNEFTEYFTVIDGMEDYQDMSSSEVRKELISIQEKMQRLNDMVPPELDGLKEWMNKKL